MQENQNNGIQIKNFWGKKFTVISIIGVIIATIAYIIALPYIPEDAKQDAKHPFFQENTNSVTTDSSSDNTNN